MRKAAGYMLLVCLLFLSCGKSESTGCQPVPVDSEQSRLIAYCTQNNIAYTAHPSGFLYQIITPGTGLAPISNSVITVNYVGKHFDNSNFDSSVSPLTSSLTLLIDGWKQGLPLLKKGGRMKLILPSALAYSCLGSKNYSNAYVIQPNEPIYFDLTLLDVQ